MMRVDVCRVCAVVGTLAVVACDSASPADAGDDTDETGADATGADTTGEGGPVEGGEVCDGPVGDAACAGRSICETYECGGKLSLYNHDGCPRTNCTTDDGCGDGWRCVPLVLGDGCIDGELSCRSDGDACVCEVTEACSGNPLAHCLPDSVYPPEGDCVPAAIGCGEALDQWHGAMIVVRDAHELAGRADLAAKITACAPLAIDAVIACGATPCEAVCGIATCEHPDVASCVMACEAATLDSPAADVERWVAAIAARPADACSCVACEGLPAQLCAGTYGCA